MSGNMDNNIKIDEKFNVRNINTTALAYLGDAVYELKIRNHLLRGGEIHGDMLHRKAIRYVSGRGKDRGNRYVVVGFSEEDRLALVDADRFNVSRPKRKNPKHV